MATAPVAAALPEATAASSGPAVELLATGASAKTKKKGSVVRKSVTQVQPAAVVAKATGGVSSVLSTTAPPGSFFVPPQVSAAQVQQVPMMQVPRRFPGHFAPHRLCNHWNAHGWCRKAETCTFAHGLQELHPDVQAQLLAQQPGMPPPSVTKDGRLVVNGSDRSKAPGAVATAMPSASQMVPVMAAARGPQMLSFPPPPASANSAAYPGSMAAAAPRRLSAVGAVAAPGAVHHASAHNFEFNVGAQPFFPVVAGAQAQKPQSIEGELNDGAENDDDDEEGDSSSSSPGKRRPAPAPLTLDDSPANVAQPAAMSRVAAASPTAVSQVVSRPVAAGYIPLQSPMRISVVSRPLPASTMTLSPTYAVASSMQSLASPMAIPMAAAPMPSPTRAPVPMPSPTRVLMSMKSPTAGLSGPMWPGSPTAVLMSPQAARSPTTPVPIDRNTLLQARQFAVQVNQGPPGLDMWAPTPTTKAGLLGFRYPAPGYISAMPKR
eukprot:TRINITY_DN6449_c0_g1_i1.p1 TRINITY_DN6449_c0_g1~~TRINITY_DN6449_c0_g1_i1.p1  ORF type:complete len:544 (-),score=74.84 TRINITY_DN6449_c0_g1_i1:58-1533(-)